MEKTIWKYKLEPKSKLMMPRGAQILSVQTQHERPHMWVLVNPETETEERNFTIYGTGNPLPEFPGTFIATFQMQGGEYIFHVFEDAEIANG